MVQSTIVHYQNNMMKRVAGWTFSFLVLSFLLILCGFLDYLVGVWIYVVSILPVLDVNPNSSVLQCPLVKTKLFLLVSL